MSEREAIAKLAASLSELLTHLRDEAVATHCFHEASGWRDLRDEVRAIAAEFSQPKETGDV